MIISGSASSSCSRDDPGSPSSFATRAVLSEYFFFSTGATDAGMGCFSGSAAVPVTGVAVTVVPVAGVGGAAVPVTGVRVAAVSVMGVEEAAASVAGVKEAAASVAGVGVAAASVAGVRVVAVPVAGAGGAAVAVILLSFQRPLLPLEYC